MHLTQVLRFWTKTNHNKLISPLIKDNFFLQTFINNHSCLTLIQHHSKGLSRVVEMFIDSCLYAFDPCFEVLGKINLYTLISSLIKYGKVFTEIQYLKYIYI